MKRAMLMAVFCALTFAGIAGGLLISRPADQTHQLAALELELRQTRLELEKAKAELNQVRKDAAERPQVATEQPKSGTQSNGANKQGPEGLVNTQGAASISKLMSDPKMREMVKAQQTAQLDMQYGKLFSLLSLSDEETSHFKKLLGDRLSLQTDLGLKFMDTSLTQDQRKALSSQFDADKKANTEAIKQFMNDDNDFKTFQHWETTQPERMQMMMGRGAFDAAGAPLTPDQEEQLINVMAEMRQRPSNVPDWTDPKKMNPAMFDEKTLQRLLQKQDADAEKVSAAAAQFLSPAQLTALAKMQKQLRDMAEMSLKMSATMFNGGNPKR